MFKRTIYQEKTDADRAMGVYNRKQRNPSEKKEILPKIVQLGPSPPVKDQDVIDMWSTSVILEDPDPTKVMSSHSSKHANCPKYRNLHNYNKLRSDKMTLNKSIWKVPSLSNNFLPFKKSDNIFTEEVTGLYRPQFRKWYDRLVHENTLVLPPMQVSTRLKNNVPDPNKLREKKYISMEHRQSGPLERFQQNELYLPNVYSQCFNCRECRKVYASNVFSQVLSTRNNVTPFCQTVGSKSGKGVKRKRHHCDVLGERYCKFCIETRNKKFSTDIENCFLNTNDVQNIHYTSYFN